MRLPILALAALALAGCGGSAASAERGAREYSAHGLTVELQAGWAAARESLTPQLRDPRERLSVGTYPLRYRRGYCAQAPSSALADLGPRDAFVTLQERGRDTPRRGFPPRPASFARVRAGAFECVPRRLSGAWIPFRDRGRRFYALVVFGRHTPARVRDQAWAILDGLRVDRSVRPRWSATP